MAFWNSDSSPQARIDDERAFQKELCSSKPEARPSVLQKLPRVDAGKSPVEVTIDGDGNLVFHGQLKTKGIQGNSYGNTISRGANGTEKPVSIIDANHNRYIYGCADGGDFDIAAMMKQYFPKPESRPQEGSAAGGTSPFGKAGGTVQMDIVLPDGKAVHITEKFPKEPQTGPAEKNGKPGPAPNPGPEVQITNPSAVPIKKLDDGRFEINQGIDVVSITPTGGLTANRLGGVKVNVTLTPADTSPPEPEAVDKAAVPGDPPQPGRDWAADTKKPAPLKPALEQPVTKERPVTIELPKPAELPISQFVSNIRYNHPEAVRPLLDAQRALGADGYATLEKYVRKAYNDGGDLKDILRKAVTEAGLEPAQASAYKGVIDTDLPAAH